ncbi:hypothetical protein G5B40_12310 [Pikeienuella piscinae]|uniref:DUF11 domain-containing protein n=1 Tax=Pikeienuella piscinae TaxID=2748098 RepID=A0A7L5C126_9RHOB|nr:hypothetical protein [Pikeienuella piscinae]QIE56176.1 hypothetical protein G5B40_12310 [Pikeienuella piscinae]
MKMERPESGFYRSRVRRLEDRVRLNAAPEAVVSDLPDDQFINEDFQFSVTFDNVADVNDADPNDIGYGPFVDVTVGPGVAVNNVSYLGVSTQAQEVGAWDGSQWVDASGDPVTEHPLDQAGGLLEIPDGVALGLDENASWLNVLAPFGSYTPDHPEIELVFSATMTESPDTMTPSGAVPGDDILITAQGDFQFGGDPLDNPSTDPPIQQGAAQSDSVTPIIMRLVKAVQLPEAEKAQGPNFDFTYTITVEIADSVTATDLNIRDLLPDNLFFLNADAPGADTIDAPGAGESQGVPGVGTVTEATFTYDMVTGTTAGNDIVITLTAYAPEFAADGTDLDAMDEDSPAAYVVATNNAEVVSADYMAPDGTIVPVGGTNSGQLQDSIDITIRPYTVLKAVVVEGGGDAKPGKYLEFNVDLGEEGFRRWDGPCAGVAGRNERPDLFLPVQHDGWRE